MVASIDGQVRAIEQWVASALPAGSARVQVEEAPHERVVKVVPARHGASVVEFRLGRFGSFGLYFGLGFAFEDVPWSDELVRETLAAISNGFEETVREWRGRLVRTEGALSLRSGRVWSDRGIRHLAGFFPLGKSKVVVHEPWIAPGATDARG